MVGYDHKEGKAATSLHHTIAGATSGALTRLLLQPLDVLKIRFQLQVEPIHRKSLQSYYKSLLQAIVHIPQDEGLSAFWKGHLPAQYLSVVYGPVQFVSFEF